jgi:hypothetical protein
LDYGEEGNNYGYSWRMSVPKRTWTYSLDPKHHHSRPQDTDSASERYMGDPHFIIYKVFPPPLTSIFFITSLWGENLWVTTRNGWAWSSYIQMKAAFLHSLPSHTLLGDDHPGTIKSLPFTEPGKYPGSDFLPRQKPASQGSATDILGDQAPFAQRQVILTSLWGRSTETTIQSNNHLPAFVWIHFIWRNKKARVLFSFSFSLNKLQTFPVMDNVIFYIYLKELNVLSFPFTHF